MQLSVRDVETLRFVLSILKEKYPDLFPGFADFVRRFSVEHKLPLHDMLQQREAVIDFEQLSLFDPADSIEE